MISSSSKRKPLKVFAGLFITKHGLSFLHVADKCFKQYTDDIEDNSQN